MKFRTKILTMLMIVLLAFSLTPVINAQTSVVQAFKAVSSFPAGVIEGSVVFSSDSLLTAKTNQLTILPYCDYIATVSYYATGTTKNFRINSYLSNFTTSDTTYWTLSQGWDTTGLYLAKPINDTINLKISGMPMRNISFLIKGLAGNTENCVLYYRIALYRKDL